MLEMDRSTVENEITRLHLLVENAREDSKLEVKRELDSFFGLVLPDIAADKLPETLVISVAKLASSARRWSIAKDVWGHVLDRFPAQRNLALFNVGIAQRMLGELREAQVSFDGVTGKFRRRVKFIRENERLEKAIDASFIGALQDRSAQALAEGHFAKSVSLFQTSLHLQNKTPAYVSAVTALYERIVNLGEVPPMHSGAVHGSIPFGSRAGSDLSDGRVHIFLCGFGWSGSGAVFDYLRQSSAVEAQFDDVELSCFDGLPAIGFGASQILRDAGRSWADTIAVVKKFLLFTVLGQGFGAELAAERSRYEKKALLAQFRNDDRELEKFVGICSRFIDRVARVPRGDTVAIYNALSDFICSSLEIKESSFALDIHNNSIHGPNINTLQLIPNARACVVFRDPRDQFVARCLESRRGAMSARAFVEGFRANVRLYADALANPEVRSRVVPVQFEEFVRSASVRTAVLAKLGVDPATVEEGVFFAPEKSAKNIGIHREFGRKDDIALIERELGDWLVTDSAASEKRPVGMIALSADEGHENQV